MYLFRVLGLACMLIACVAVDASAQVNVQVNNGGRRFVPLFNRGRQQVVVNNFGNGGFVQPQAVFVQPQFVPSQVFVGQSFGSFGGVRVQSFSGCRGF